MNVRMKGRMFVAMGTERGAMNHNVSVQKIFYNKLKHQKLVPIVLFC